MTPALPDIERAFWSSLGSQLALADMPIRSKGAALHWLSEAIGSAERHEKTADIARVMEEIVLDLIRIIRSRDLPFDAARRLIELQLVPLMEGPLLQHFNPTLRQMVGILIGMNDQFRGTRTMGVEFPDGTHWEVEISELEAIHAGLAAFASVTAEEPQTDVVGGPTWIEPRIERIAGDGRIVRVPYRVPLVLLLAEADTTTRIQLAEALQQYFEAADPEIADALGEYHRVLAEGADDLVQGHEFTELITTYALSAYFSLNRDLPHGVGVLRNASLESVDRFCGLGRGAETLDAGSLLRQVLAGSQGRLPSSSTRGLSVLGVRSKQILDGIRGAMLARVSGDIQRSSLEWVQAVADGAQRKISVFDALWDFLIALIVAEVPDDFGIPPEASSALREWVRRYLRASIAPRAQAPPADESEGRETEELRHGERLRRQIHALALRLGVLIAASPSHIQAWESLGISRDDIIVAWLVRSLILADRLLVIVYHDQGLPAHAVGEHLERAVRSLDANVDVDSYPDMLNPFIYGPDEYDHGLVALLAILEAFLEDTAGVPVRPFWLDDEMQAVLSAIAQAPESEGEAVLKEGRTKGKPNRLGVTLDRTPQELASSILKRVGRGTGTI